MMKKIFNLLTFVLVSWLLIPAISHAQDSIFDTSSVSLFSNDDEFLKVEEAFTFNFYQNNDKLELSFDIAEGYYLYRQQFKFKTDNNKIPVVNLPQGKDHEDEFFGIQQIYIDPLNIVVDLNQITDSRTITIRYQGCAEKGLCYPPVSQVIKLSEFTPASGQQILSALNNSPTSTSSTFSETSASEQHQLASMLKNGSLWLTLLAFFVGGLLLSFTPCVFPMYPILTGIIVGQGDKLTTKHAFFLSFSYVQGMAITYTLLGIVVALAGAQFQAMFQHPAVLIVLSILFVFLALSMFGTFNLTLPSSWQNKLNNISSNQKGGSYWGVLSMGAISALVASPCTTAPLTGALLYISQSGDIILGASALYALSLGMGLPLLVLGSSGGKLLPKAGNWMNVIKNVFGLLLLAVPIFLLERFLPEIIISIMWLGLLLASSFYFMSINQSKKSTIKKYILTLIIASTCIFLIFKIIPNNVTSDGFNAEKLHQSMFIKVKNLSELKNQVNIANKTGKTVMVDLYADWCIACKEFEEYTFNDEKVQSALSNTVLLQVDLTETGSKSSIALMKYFNVFGLPSILFFNLNGDELTQQRVTGFMSADPFTAHVNKIFN